MKFLISLILNIFYFGNLVAEISHQNFDILFNVGKMESYNKEFTLYFKPRDKAILARGEDKNYIKDYPQDLYIYIHKTKEDVPLISYEWFPRAVKNMTNHYKYPVFPEDFAYYLLEDNNTLVMINAKKKNKNTGIYKKLIIALVIFAVIFLLATSGRFILPQILQILKIGAPFLTKFIGL